MRILCKPTLARTLLLLVVLASNVSGKEMIIRLNGFLNENVADISVRSMFHIMATRTEIVASLQRKVLGSANREVVDVKAEFKINDDNFVNEWRTQALVAFRQSPVRQKKTAETRLPNGYWAIYVEEVPPSFHDNSANNSAIDDNASMQLVAKTLSKLNQLIEQKEYEKIGLSPSEGDAIPAVPVSLGELLENPQKWDGKRVKLVGWFSRGEEKSVVYPSRLYAWMGKRGIWVGESSTIAVGVEEYLEKYEGRREIEGVFRASMHGHLGGFPCTIDRVTVNRAR